MAGLTYAMRPIRITLATAPVPFRAAFALMCLVDTPPMWLFRALGILFTLLAVGSVLLLGMGSRLGRGSGERRWRRPC